MRIIASATQKGGAAKTTTAAALTSGAIARGLKALAIDLDPQCNLSLIYGIANTSGIYEVIKGRMPIKKAIKSTPQGDILPGSANLAALDLEYGKKAGSNTLVKNAIKPILAEYDIIVIDCPPSLGLPLVNALTAATEVIIPSQADILSIQGLVQLVETINAVRSANNPNLSITGLFLTRYNNRSILSREMAECAKDKCTGLSVPFLDTPIREGIAIREAQAMQMSIFDYAPKCKQAADYAALLDKIKIGG